MKQIVGKNTTRGGIVQDDDGPASGAVAPWK